MVFGERAKRGRERSKGERGVAEILRHHAEPMALQLQPAHINCVEACAGHDADGGP
jgi:hypothetical protein